jgi:hypothetical protein
MSILFVRHVSQRARHSAIRIAALMVVALALLMAGAVGSADAQSYTYVRIAGIGTATEPWPFGGDPAPGRDDLNYFFDFEPGGVNAFGDLAYGCDLESAGNPVGEGVYARVGGITTRIMRAGDPAPGGGTFGGFGVFSPVDINNSGQVAFAFGLEPFMSPLGANAGLYRYDSSTGVLRALMVPYVTDAPGGGKFQGSFFRASINNNGDVAFPGIVPSTAGRCPNGLGLGVYKANPNGNILKVAAPGDKAPGGGQFDMATNASINDRGDVAFGAHIAGEECFGAGECGCFESVYFKSGASDKIVSVAHQGAPAPGGGTYRIAYGPYLNNKGSMVFIGDLTPAPDFGLNLAVYLYDGKKTLRIAGPGDPMPGGGNFVTESFNISNYDINSNGDVSFLAALDTSTGGVPDTGVYVRKSKGAIVLVARTGTVIPGLGTVAHIRHPYNVGAPQPSSSALLSDGGAVVFVVTMEDGSTLMIQAIPN